MDRAADSGHKGPGFKSTLRQKYAIALIKKCARILTRSVTSSLGVRIYGKHRTLLVIRQMESLRDIPGDCKKSTKYLRRESVVRLYAGRLENASIEIGV